MFEIIIWKKLSKPILMDRNLTIDKANDIAKSYIEKGMAVKCDIVTDKKAVISTFGENEFSNFTLAKLN